MAKDKDCVSACCGYDDSDIDLDPSSSEDEPE